MISSEEILKKYWNHNTFRSQQKEIITSVLEGNDTIALLPTGGGKSICYQVPTMQQKGICIVISPLIALMKDQVASLLAKDIKAVAITSELSFKDTIVAFDNLQFGNYKFVYLSPEKLQTPLILEKLQQLDVHLIAVDEAHCISAWGHDFRPSYLQLSILKKTFPKIPILAVTATATKQVLEDIKAQLTLKNTQFFSKSFYRKNIAHHVVVKEDTFGTLIQLLKKHQKKPSIVFVNTQKKAQEIQTFLQKKHLQASYYHGGLSSTEKKIAYDNWFSEKTPIMVATNAFGMGIDKNNVATIIHLHVPNSIENYVQESGRAGRDDKQANALILLNKTTLLESKEILLKNLPEIAFLRQVYKHLNQYYQIAKGEIPTQKQPFDIAAFCQQYSIQILKTYNAVKALANQNIIAFNEYMHQKPTIRFRVKSAAILRYSEKNKQKEAIIKVLLRSYGGIMENNTIINETTITAKLHISKGKLQKEIQELHKDGILYYSKAKNTASIQFLVPREDALTINTIQHSIIANNKLKLAKMDAMLAYTKDINTCRSKQLVAYFEETLATDCGICGICLQKIPKKNVNNKDLVKQIKDFLKQHEQLSSKEMILLLNTSEKDILFALEIMLEKNIITVNSQHKFSLQ